jgi:hypothetical protein
MNKYETTHQVASIDVFLEIISPPSKIDFESTLIEQMPFF